MSRLPCPRPPFGPPLAVDWFNAHSMPSILAVLVIAAAIGCEPAADKRDGRQAELSRRHGIDPNVSRDRDVGVPLLLKPTTQTQPALPPGDYRVVGKLSDADLRELEDLVSRQTDDPIMNVRVLRPGLVEVTTGVLRGPVNGGGRILDFEKQDGRWRQINMHEVKVWRS